MKKYTLDDFLTGKVDVCFGTKGNAMKLLKECEKLGILWNSGDRATEYFPKEPILRVNFYGNGCLTHGIGNHGGRRTVIDFDELVWKSKKRYQIIIDCDGDTTTARMIVNGKEVKTAQSKRNPADKFNWKMGAQLAFDRLFGEKKSKKAEKKPGVFNVGDRVVCACEVDGNKKMIGERGRVVDVKFYIGKRMVAVELEKHFPFLHSCMGASKNCNGWWFFEKELRHE